MATAKSISATSVLVFKFWPRELQKVVENISLTTLIGFIKNLGHSKILEQSYKPKIAQSPPKAVNNFGRKIVELHDAGRQSISIYSKVKLYRVFVVIRVDERARSI